MRMARRKRLRELGMGLAALIAAVMTVVVVVWVNIGALEAADRGNAEARQELAWSDMVQDAIYDQKNALGGLAATHDKRFIDPYEDGHARLEGAIGHLRDYAADTSPSQRHDVGMIEQLAQRWMGTVAQPQITAVQQGRRPPAENGDGARLSAQMGALVDALRAAEMRKLHERQVAQASAYRASREALVLGSLAALAFAILILRRTGLQAMTERQIAERDADQLKRALEHAQAAEQTKTRFLANMSHEMRTPLNGVAGMVEALARTQLDARQLECVDAIRFSSVPLDQLIGDLLSVSRDGANAADQHAAAPFQLGTALRVAVEPFAAQARAKGLAFALSVPADADIDVVGDAPKLCQLLACLLSNAVKFTDCGKVSLRVMRLDASRFAFEIGDTGIGFDDDSKALMFETFRQSDDSETRRHGGAGLGLARALRLVGELGGVLDAHSTRGVGSTFGFEVEFDPVQGQVPIAATQTTACIEAVSPQDCPARILIVDDNPTNRKVLELILDQLDFEWVSVADGLQAVEAAGRQTFAAILMDIQMPVMDGLTATREIRRLEREGGRPSAPVIIVSANCQPEDVEAGIAAGAELHLSKPVQVHALIDALNDVLADHQEAA